MGDGNIAIIGGTGFEQLPPDIFAEPLVIATPHGQAHVWSLSNNYVEPYKLYFLARHGPEHGTPPHRINYQANTAALAQLGVDYVLATNAVGSLRRDLPPGSLVLLNDFIDFTRGRPLSYFDEGESWRHTDFSVPYSPRLRQAVLLAAERLQVPLVPSGTYLCCDGPRFETPAEIRLFAQWGADIVGMTGIPEVVFSREAGMEYASLAIVTNFGAGVTEQPVDHQAVVARMSDSLPVVRELMFTACVIVVENTMRS